MRNIPEHFQINSQGHLEVSGCDTIELARKFGTPLYVLDETRIRQNCRDYVAGLAEGYPDTQVCYAGKAFLCRAICCLMQQEGLGLDVVSGGELFTALKAGFPPEDIYFHGNNKSRQELEFALQSGVGCLVIDGLHEVELLAGLTRATGTEKRQRVLLRLAPGVEPHTHVYTQTGQEDSKFGLAINGGQALAGVKAVLNSPHLELTGFHVHIGSQILDLASYGVTAGILARFLAEVRAETGFTAKVLNLGGGLGIRYTRDDKLLPVREAAGRIGQMVREVFSPLDYPWPKLVLEPGRSIVGDAGVTLYTIGNIKTIPGIRKYVMVDGGMPDNPRVALYQAVYEAVIANKAGRPAKEAVTVAGKTCESGDILIRDIPLAVPESGDILAVFSTGAYTYSMASNYNRLPRPAVVLVANGQGDLIVARETYEQIVANDLVPPRLCAEEPREAAEG
ncbi:MAG TPA: diaminopimelate decarboxylase [Firmicutes bacterium]|nr:diaminopimelate decarboxylase [Bacillota bacterium]